MKTALNILLCLLAFQSDALICKTAAPQLHSPIAAKTQDAPPPFQAAMLAEGGPRFRHTTYGGRGGGEHYKNLQDTGIVLTVIGLVLAILGGLWLKSTTDEEERQKAANNGKSYNGLNVAAASVVLIAGISVTCVGIPILLTHL